jgi:hypothetical protein
MQTMRTLMAWAVPAGVCLSLGLSAAAGCGSPGNTDDPCTNAGGVCQSQTLACYDSYPYPCASQASVCCAPSKNPGPSATPTPTSTPAAADAAAE